jgi:hypothetical protein
MAINKNHPFEEINGVRCAVVETEVTASRAEFLKALLAFNGYEVMVTEAQASKTAKPGAAENSTGADKDSPPLYNLSVTDVMFNSTNAIFGRMLKTPSGRIVTQAYWLQKEAFPDDETPYYEKQSLFK